MDFHLHLNIKNYRNSNMEVFYLALLFLFGAAMDLIKEKDIYRAEGIYRAREKGLFPVVHPLSNFDIIDCFKNKKYLNAVCSRCNLPRVIKLEGYITNSDKYDDTGTHWVVIYNNVYIDGFRSYPSEETFKFMKNGGIETHLF